MLNDLDDLRMLVYSIDINVALYHENQFVYLYITSKLTCSRRNAL